MINIYNFDDYRLFLRDYIQNLPKKGRGWGAQLAQALNITPVIVSQVLKGHRNFSEEQGLEICEYISLTAEESEFFMSLLRLHRAGSHKLQIYYQKKIAAQKTMALEIKSRLDKKIEFNESAKAKYYSEWFYGGVRLYSALEKQGGIEDICNRFGMPVMTVQGVMEFLIRHDLILQKDDGSFQWTSASTHIGKDSPLVNRHHKNWRLKAFENMDLKREEDLFFTSPMVISKELFSQLQQDILDFIKLQSKKISEAECEELVLLNIDLCKI